MSFLRMISTPETYEQGLAHYEELAFQRRASQGQLSAPMVISDGQSALQSMTNGNVYDSKSEMRKEYRRAGVEEVGNEKQKPGRDPHDVKAKRARQREGIKAALHRAHSRMGFGAP